MKSNQSRRTFVKKLAYVVPVVVSLRAEPASPGQDRAHVIGGTTGGTTGGTIAGTTGGTIGAKVGGRIGVRVAGKAGSGPRDPAIALATSRHQGFRRALRVTRAR